jgi:hypothetical protein
MNVWDKYAAVSFTVRPLYPRVSMDQTAGMGTVFYIAARSSLMKNNIQMQTKTVKMYGTHTPVNKADEADVLCSCLS